MTLHVHHHRLTKIKSATGNRRGTEIGYTDTETGERSMARFNTAMTAEYAAAEVLRLRKQERGEA